MTTIVTHAQAERIRAAFTALGFAASEAVHHYHVAVADIDPAAMERVRAAIAKHVRPLPPPSQFIKRGLL